jgi:hypothetical protein
MATRRNAFLPISTLAVLLLAGCGPALPEYTLVRSPAGMTIQLEHKGRVPLTDRRTALRIRYRTDVAIDDPAPLRRETDEVLRTFQGEADAAGVETILIEARSLRGERWSRIGRSRRFVFQRDPAGRGQLHELERARTTAVKPL